MKNIFKHFAVANSPNEKVVVDVEVRPLLFAWLQKKVVNRACSNQCHCYSLRIAYHKITNFNENVWLIKEYTPLNILNDPQKAGSILHK